MSEEVGVGSVLFSSSTCWFCVCTGHGWMKTKFPGSTALGTWVWILSGCEMGVGSVGLVMCDLPMILSCEIFRSLTQPGFSMVTLLPFRRDTTNGSGS